MLLPVRALTTIAGLAVACAAAGEAERGWTAGAYAFSDELGGFRITGATGTGTRDDPVVLDQELFSASAVTMVIRAVRPTRPHGMPGRDPTGMIHLRLRTLNNSGIAWTEVEFELQEQLGRPSTHGDGLSFDQRRSEDDNRSSDRFAIHDTDFDPYDRIVFREGTVDPLQEAGFSMFITDFTPKLEFYLRQDPRTPVS